MGWVGENAEERLATENSTAAARARGPEERVMLVGSIQLILLQETAPFLPGTATLYFGYGNKDGEGIYAMDSNTFHDVYLW